MEKIWIDKTRYDRAEKLYYEWLCNVSFLRHIHIYICIYKYIYSYPHKCFYVYINIQMYIDNL